MDTGIIVMEHEVKELSDRAMYDSRGTQAMRQALASLRGWHAYERIKREEWIEVEDREMAAYHRGYERGLERGIAVLESALKAAGVELS
ncbi:hypothetical protein [Nitrolancea hollandica]|uniref:Uncharacterized protein n=1 Tax=Nitrolancea hollandica Lb TaxID=1129897 RepID=I4EED3_9BACT|nr:hypothetical protein [Nitrolancea hollandica]CCF83045.1 hypothetical protein NITHO_1780011 [Nitrolancea hollandica Lb]